MCWVPVWKMLGASLNDLGLIWACSGPARRALVACGVAELGKVEGLLVVGGDAASDLQQQPSSQMHAHRELRCTSGAQVHANGEAGGRPDGDRTCSSSQSRISEEVSADHLYTMFQLCGYRSSWRPSWLETRCEASTWARRGYSCMWCDVG